MDFALSEMEQSVRDLAKEVARNAIDDERSKELMASQDWFDQTCWQALADTELLGLGLSGRAGGTEQGLLSVCLLLQQLGRRAPTVPAVESLSAALVLDARDLPRAPRWPHAVLVPRERVPPRGDRRLKQVERGGGGVAG